MVTNRRNPFIASILSVLVTGLGQFYNGQFKKALGFLLLSLLLIAFCLNSSINWYFGIYYGRFILVVLIITSIVDAFAVALKSKEYQLKAINKWYYYLTTILLACGLYLWLSLNIPVKAYVVQFNSMKPTLVDKDKIMVSNQPGYQPKRGEIVLFEDPRQVGCFYIKRVLALGGEELTFKNSRVYIDGKEIINTWMIAPGQFSRAYTLFDNVYKIPKNAVFVLGDNIDVSVDSRELGPISIKKIKGKVLYIFESKDKSRIGMKI